MKTRSRVGLAISGILHCFKILKRIRGFLLVSLLSSASLFASDIRPAKCHLNFATVSPDLLMFSVDFENEAQGLQLNVGGVRLEFFKTNRITANLHLANGRVVAPTDPRMLNAPVGTGSLGATQWSVMADFPWVTNTLEECWIEVRTGLERYWLEMPYGFYRDPKDPLTPSTAGGPPKLASAMKTLTVHDHVLPWENVQYELGKMRNHWGLSLTMSNPFDAVAEVALYREDNKSWDLHTPRTALRVRDNCRSEITGRCVSLRLPDGHMRRIDTFSVMDREGGDQRCWGRLEISVDDQNYRIAVPSSLYKYSHGHYRTD